MPDPEQAIEVPKILLDDVPMRAAVRDTQLGEQLVEVPTQPWYVAMVLAFEGLFEARDPTYSSRTGSSFSGSVPVEVFKVLSQYRIQQRLWSRSLTNQLVGVFLIFSRDRILPHRVVCMTLRMRILHGFFILFSV